MPRYIAKACARHPELGGERRNGNCPVCQRERSKPKRSRASQRARVKTWRDANREQDRAQSHGEKMLEMASVRLDRLGAADPDPEACCARGLGRAAAISAS